MEACTRRSRRLPVRGVPGLAAALVPALVATLLVWSAPAAHADDDDLGVVPFDIGTYNFRADRSYKKFKTAIDAFKDKVQVAGLQEIADADKNEYLMDDSGWGYYRPPELRQNPVIWDERFFQFLSTPDDGYRIAKGREIESKHETGTEYKEDSFATVVRLRHVLSGNELSVINVHLLSGASLVGKPWPGKPKRFDMLCDQIRGLMRLVKAERERGNEVYVLGDFNVGFQADERERHKKLPYRRFKRQDFRSMWQGGELEKKGTYENAYLDQVWSKRTPLRRQVARDVKGSDHYPAVATYLVDIELPLPVETPDVPLPELPPVLPLP